MSKSLKELTNPWSTDGDRVIFNDHDVAILTAEPIVNKLGTGGGSGNLDVSFSGVSPNRVISLVITDGLNTITVPIATY